MRNLVIGVVVVAVLFLGGYLLLNGSKKSADTNNSSTNNNTSTNNSTNNSTTASDSVTVTYTNTGFTPFSVTLKKGGTLIWKNDANDQVQIGVNPHPVHTGNRAITNGEFTLDLNPGGTKTLTINDTGTFSYHNHLDPTESGTIIVQ